MIVMLSFTSYFVAHILQFQFHHRLCEITYKDQFEETEVFNCDIYDSNEAGAELKWVAVSTYNPYLICYLFHYRHE